MTKRSVPSVLSDVLSQRELPRGRHWLGPEYYVLEKNTQVVENSAKYLQARHKQSDAYADLLEARIRIARLFAVIGDLPAEFAHARMLKELQRRIELIDAAIRLAAAQKDLAQYQPANARTDAGVLSPGEVEGVLQQFPDVPAEAVAPIVMALRGLIAEKKS